MKYGLWAELDNADDNALSYVAHMLPCVLSCNLTLVNIQVKGKWSARTEVWQNLDEAILMFAQGTLFRAVLDIHRDADVPPWGTLPYKCRDDIFKQMLPRCAARGVLYPCGGWSCRLVHDPKR